MASLPDEKELKAKLASINEAQSKDSNLSNLQKDIGGTTGLLKLLQTDTDKGLTTSEIITRRAKYGSNSLPSAPRKTFLELFIDTFDDETVQILAVAAAVSLVVGMYEDPSTGYIEGVAILAAVLIVSIVTAVNDYQKESQFRELSEVNDAVDIIVIRDTKAVQVPIDDIVIGDIVCIEAGDSIPCDGVLLRADGLEVDESALTGEPIDIEKNILTEEGGSDPFLLSGCAASAGTARFVAIAVGKESQWGVIKAALEKEQEETPLQEKLNIMANQIGNVGIGAAIATFLAMMFMKLVVKPDYLEDISVFKHALDAFIIGVTIVVVAVPEGLPLAVTISLAYSTKKMLADNNLIRHLAACETMGNATNICSDKTGTLTENRMTVVKAVFGDVKHEDTAPESMTKAKVSDSVSEIILQNIATCSTARIMESTTTPGETEVIGNKTEAALLILAKSEFFGGDDYEIRRTEAHFGKPGGSRLFPFSSKRKCMSVLVKEDNSDSDSISIHSGPVTRSARKKAASAEWKLYHKGAGEIVISKCTKYTDSEGVVHDLTAAKREEYEQTISYYASQALRCVALAHRDGIQRIVKPETATAEECAEECEKDMILDGLVGIVDPLRPDVVDAVQTCQRAGIIVRMVTGDNLDTAKAIAKEAGILTEGGVAIEGAEFRKMTPAQLDAILPNLQVLARSSPEDKNILVQRLNGGLMPKTKEEWLEAHPKRSFEKEKDLLLPGYYEEWAKSRNGVGEVVGVTGDGTNDGPALKAADVGLSMGISGTDVAKNASDIIIMDDKFSSIVKAVLWGRSVFDNIRKFLQFQLTVNVVALTITFLSAVAGFSPPLNAVMMLWVNLIMDAMGALALGTEPPTRELLLRRPYKRDASLINLPMWRNILFQAAYQLGLLIYILNFGPQVFGCESGSAHHFTLIFNAFVLCQVFNEFNAREIGDVFNPLKRMHKSPMFLGVIIFTIASQWFIVTYGGDFTQTTPLTLEEWKVTFMYGAASIPVGFFMRQLPVDEDPNSFAGIAHPNAPIKEKKSSVWITLLLPLLAAGVYKFNEIK